LLNTLDITEQNIPSNAPMTVLIPSNKVGPPQQQLAYFQAAAAAALLAAFLPNSEQQQSQFRQRTSRLSCLLWAALLSSCGATAGNLRVQAGSCPCVPLAAATHCCSLGCSPPGMLQQQLVMWRSFPATAIATASLQ
jgi:hypothetical protein